MNAYTGPRDERIFIFILSIRVIIKKKIESCCLGITHYYLDKIQVNRHLGLIFLETNLMHLLRFCSKRRLKSRRCKENQVITKKQSWTVTKCSSV